MNKLMGAKMIYPVVAILLVIALYLLYKKNTGQVKVSEFGKYKGYSEAVYDGSQRISDYLTLSNGTRLACAETPQTKRMLRIRTSWTIRRQVANIHDGML